MMMLAGLVLVAATDGAATPATEVVAYRSVSYGCSHGNNCIQSSFLHYNWSAITTVVAFTQTNITELCALAKRQDTKVVVAHGETLNTSNLGDGGCVAEWISNGTDSVVALRSIGVCGLNLDVEHFRFDGTARTRQQLTDLVCNIQKRLEAERQSLFAVNTKIWGDTAHFDLAGLAGCTEHLVPMGYDMTSKTSTTGAPVASSNAPLPLLASDLKTYYLQRGVPPAKLILGLPLYGYSFPCAASSSAPASAAMMGLTASSLRPAGLPPPCHVEGADSADWQVGLGTVLGKLDSGVTTAAGRDPTSESPYFEYNETKHDPKGRHQVWHEDSASLTVKAGLIRELWSIDALWNVPTSAESSAVWTAIDVRHGGSAAVATETDRLRTAGRQAARRGRT